MELDLTRQELIDLIEAYDEYIQESVKFDRYASGWRPASIAEFYDDVFLLEGPDELDDFDEEN
ncbi:MAG: hypothetical protein KGQ58_05960 [Proteobacteria bacterium]|nr:hypothetical protein [Pseudomonadota bacterium]